MEANIEIKEAQKVIRKGVANRSPASRARTDRPSWDVAVVRPCPTPLDYYRRAQFVGDEGLDDLGNLRVTEKFRTKSNATAYVLDLLAAGFVIAGGAVVDPDVNK
jgi:hypothetical protein